MSTHDPNNDQCRENIALRCPVGIECPHGYDHCPQCDACTCPGAPPAPQARTAEHVRRRMKVCPGCSRLDGEHDFGPNCTLTGDDLLDRR